MTTLIWILISFLAGVGIMYLSQSWFKLHWKTRVQIKWYLELGFTVVLAACAILVVVMLLYAGYLTWFVEPPEIQTQNVHCEHECQVFVMEDNQCMVVSVYFPNGDFRYSVKVLNVNSNTIALTIKTPPVSFETCIYNGSIRAWPGEKGVIDLQSFDLYIER